MSVSRIASGCGWFSSLVAKCLVVKMFVIMSSVVIAVMIGTSSATQASPRVRVDGSRLVDAGGNEIVLKGINAFGTSKLPPFIRESDYEIFPLIKELGYDHVRLLFNWEAFEPERGRYNESYFSSYEKLVQMAKDADLMVVVDFHQDAYSRVLSGGCGEGFPLWATPPGVTPRQPAHGESCQQWILYALTDFAGHRAWDHFYKDSFDVKTAYFAMLRQVVRRLRGYDQVIGYDLLNEPWGWEATQISEFYRQAASVVSSVDSSALIFFEPHPTTAFSWGGQTNLVKPTFKNAVYAPHLYDFNILARGVWSGSMDGIQKTLNHHVEKAHEWDVPLYIGEWGAPATVANISTFVENVWRILLNNHISSAQWNITPGWDPTAKDGFNGEDLSIIDHHRRPRANYVRPIR